MNLAGVYVTTSVTRKFGTDDCSEFEGSRVEVTQEECVSVTIMSCTTAGCGASPRRPVPEAGTTTAMFSFGSGDTRTEFTFEDLGDRIVCDQRIIRGTSNCLTTSR